MRDMMSHRGHDPEDSYMKTPRWRDLEQTELMLPTQLPSSTICLKYNTLKAKKKKKPDQIFILGNQKSNLSQYFNQHHNVFP